jgi:hypothetical protein
MDSYGRPCHRIFKLRFIHCAFLPAERSFISRSRRCLRAQTVAS